MSVPPEFTNVNSGFSLCSRWSCPIPNVDLCTFIFSSPTHELPKTPIYIAAEKPETHQLSMHSHRRLVKKIAAGLKATGLKEGDRVLMFSGNSVFFPSLYLGIIASGAIFTGANPTYTVRELAFQLQNSGARFCIVREGSVETAVEAAEEVGLPQSNIFVFDDSLLVGDIGGRSEPDRWVLDASAQARQFGVRHWSELVSPKEDFVWHRFTTREGADRIATINYSSGTTGVPKGVEITHHNLIANALGVIYTAHLAPHLRKLPQRQLGMLPMYHAFGQNTYVITSPSLGTPVYIMPKFDFLQFLKYVEMYKITTIAGVPPIMVAFAKHPEVSKYDLSSVRVMKCGAAPLSSDVQKEAEQRLSKQANGAEVSIKQGWGMTETTCTVLSHHPNDKTDDHGSVGELMPNCEGRVVDESGNCLPANSAGELLVRAPNVCKGYWNNPKATKEMFTEGGRWLKTGDIAYYDDLGKFYIVDRKKELIKVMGNQVAPAELEGVLLEHPKVADVAIVGVLAPNGDERPRAYVVKSGDINEDDIVDWVRGRAARHKWITGGVQFVEAVPKNPSGKILRQVLREMAAKAAPKL